MKQYAPIAIGLIVLVVVVYMGNIFMNKGDGDLTKKDSSEMVGTRLVSGKVTRVFEGDNVLDYMFNINETSTTTVDLDGARVSVVGEDGISPFAVYFSYEGGRGYTPINYIDNVIAGKVNVINPSATSTVGEYEWQEADSATKEWHIASVGQWLVVVENSKSAHDEAMLVLESLNVK